MPDITTEPLAQDADKGEQTTAASPRSMFAEMSARVGGAQLQRKLARRLLARKQGGAESPLQAADQGEDLGKAQAETKGPESKDPPSPSPGPPASGTAAPPAAPAPPVAPIATDRKFKSPGQMMNLMLEDLKRYADAQADWANDPKLSDAQRAVLWRWVTFATESDANLAGCGQMRVSELNQKVPTVDLLDDLRSYAGARAGARSTAKIKKGTNSVGKALSQGKDLRKLEESMGGPTLHRIIDGDETFNFLTETPGLIDYTIDYNHTCDPTLDAETGTEITSIAAMRDDKTPYAAYKTALPEIRNFHRFQQGGLKAVAANKKDTTKKRPFTLVLHSALDHNGAFHRDKHVTDVLAHPDHLTLMIEGVETLDAIKGQIGGLARQYGQNDKIDQVMIAGHGNASSIQLGGKMGMGDRGEVEEKPQDLKTGDPATKALLDELLSNMDPKAPNYRVVFNACLTNSNSVDTKAIKEAIAAGKDPAQAVREAMQKNPSFVDALKQQAKDLKAGKPADPKDKDLTAIGANNSIGQVPLMDKNGALDLKDPDDPFATGSKLSYAESGVESLGVMRAVVESWAQDKAQCLAAMQRRVKRPASTWQAAMLKKIFQIILASYSDDIATINDFSEWAGRLGEGSHEAECRVYLFTPPDSIKKHMIEVVASFLTSFSFSDDRHFPMVLHQTEYLTGLTGPEPFLADLSYPSFDCKTAADFISGRVRDHYAELLAGAQKKGQRGQLLLALLHVAGNETPLTEVKDFLIAHGVSGDRLTSQATQVLAKSASDDRILERLGVKAKGADPVHKANADTNSDGKNDTYVQPMTGTGVVASPLGDVEVRSAPDSAAGVAGTLKDGDQVTLAGKAGTWYAVQHNLRLAYVPQDRITLQQADRPEPFAARGVVSNPYGAPVRSAPESSAPALSELKYNDEVTIVARTKDWFAVHQDHRTAYISRLDVDPKKKTVVRWQHKGAVTNPGGAELKDSLRDDAKTVVTLKLGDAVDILGKIEDEPSAMGVANKWYGVKNGDGIAYVEQASIGATP